MQEQMTEGRVIETDEPGVTLRVVRIENSDDAPAFGKMYHVYAEDGDARVLAYANRFKRDEDALKWARETFSNVRETIIRDLDYARKAQKEKR